MKLIFASHNLNKIKEVKNILKDYPIEVISLNELNIKDGTEESGTSFIENAIIKAKSIAKKHECFVIAEDAGLEVFALNNKPGIYSKRYSGKGDYENNLKLLQELNGVEDRRARFVSAIAFYNKGKLVNTYEGYMYGKIDYQLTGTNNFGYDPLFIPEGYDVSNATLNMEIKNSISHRFNSLKLFLEDFINIIKC